MAISDSGKEASGDDRHVTSLNHSHPDDRVISSPCTLEAYTQKSVSLGYLGGQDG